MTMTRNIRFYDNQYLTDANTTKRTGESGYPFDNALTTIRSQVYVPTMATHRTWYLYCDFGWNAPISFLAVIGPLGEIFNVSSAAVITLKANNIDDFTGTTPYSETITASEYGLYKHIDNSDGGYRYWRLDVDDSTNPESSDLDDYPVKIGHIYFGDHVQITERTINSGFVKSEIDPSTGQTSMNGQKYFDNKQKYLSYAGLGLGYMPADERSLLEQMFYDYGKSDPFFISLDPSLKFSTYEWELSRLVRFDKEPQLTSFYSDIYSMTFSVSEAV
jgi:hypothetical protein